MAKLLTYCFECLIRMPYKQPANKNHLKIEESCFVDKALKELQKIY